MKHVNTTTLSIYVVFIIIIESEDRIRNGAKRIMKVRSTTTQVRLDNFFKVTSVTPGKRKVYSFL